MALLLTLGSQLHCAHGGLAVGAGHSSRVRVAGAPALTNGPMPVAGCPNVASGMGSQSTGNQHTVVAGFCVQAVPMNFASRVTSQGAPLLLGSSVILGLPSGAPLVSNAGQARVFAT